MRLLRAVLVIFAVPSLIYIINVFQDYSDANLTLTPLQQLVLDLQPFILVGLVIFGILVAVRHRGGNNG